MTAQLARRNRAGARAAIDDARLQRLVLLAVLLAHVAAWLVLDYLARYRPAQVDIRAESSISIAFVQQQPAPVEALAPVQSAAARDETLVPRAITRRAAPEDQGVAVEFMPRDPARRASREPALDARRLFTPDGGVRAPPESKSTAADPFARPAPTERAPVLTHQSTRFNRAWTRDGENLGQQIVGEVPLAFIVLQGVYLPKCPPDSNHPNCEATAREQRARIPSTQQSGKQPW